MTQEKKPGSREGKPSLIAVYPATQEERDLINKAAILVAGRRKPSASALMMEAAIKHIETLPDLTDEMRELLAKVKEQQQPRAA